MLSSVLYMVSTNAMPIVLYFLVVLIISFVLYFSMENINIDKKIIMFDTTFANLKREKLIAVTGLLARAFMTVYATFNYSSENIMTYYIMIILSDLIFVVFNIRRIFFEIPSITAQIAIIYVIELIGNYRTQVNEDATASIIQGLLMSFVIIYSIVVMVKDFETIIHVRSDQRKKKLERKRKGEI